MALLANDDNEDPELMTLISQARNGKGVHVYVDEPDKARGLVMATPVNDVFATRTEQFKWTCIFRATGNKPIAAAELSNSNDTYTVMVGISGQRSSSLYKKPYAIIRDKNKWSDPNQHFLDVYDGKKGDYICLQALCRLPQFDRSNNVTMKNLFQFFFNGKHIPRDQSFASDADLKDVLSRMAYHGTYFNDVECTEHHMEYTGIMEGLPQDATKEYISWRGILLCYMSVGGSAVVTGKYKAVNPNVDGVLLGIEQNVSGSSQVDYHVFEEQQDPDQMVTFLLTISFGGVHINSDRGFTWESQMIKPGNNFVWLAVQNFDIQNVEIHTGIKPRG